jgi:nicotinate-nucleotide adenylyltransferase
MNKKEGGIRLGIMGGTFDPIHLGHLRAAEEIYRAFGLDQIVFVPAARPPHKGDAVAASARQRYEMVSLATVFTPYFTVSSVELDRPGMSYSVETIREFRKRYGPQARFSFIVGVDAFLEMAAWRRPRDLLGLTQVIVTARPGWRLHEVEGLLTPRQRAALGHPTFRAVRIAEIDPARIEAERAPREVLLVEVASLDIASREIRRLAEQGRSIRHLVPDAVEAYVTKNRLYQSREPRASRRGCGEERKRSFRV